MVFSDGVLSGVNNNLSVYITEIQTQTNEKRSEAGFGLYSWINASVDEKFRLKHIENVKKALEEPALLAFYGYGTINDILGRGWSAHPENVNRHLKQASFNIINDIRTVIDALALPEPDLYIGDLNNNRIIKTIFGTGEGWTVLNIPDGAFGTSLPLGIAYDSANNDIYGADQGNARIFRTKIGGGFTFYGTFGLGGGVGEFQNPAGLDFDPSTGFIYVADPNSGQVIKTQMGGGGWTSLAGLNGPQDVWYDSATEFLYIADGNRIVKIKIDGSEQTTLAISADGIYYDSVTDFIYLSQGTKIIKIKIDGSGQTTLETFASSSLVEVSYDISLKFIYAADTVSHRIVKVKNDGSGKETYGSQGSGVGQFDNPRGIATSRER